MKPLTPIIILLSLVAVALAAVDNDTEGVSALSGQLRIYRSTLLQGAGEEIRIDAAVELLQNKDPQALEIVLEALKADSNPAAQTSVCKAISQFRRWPELIPKRKEFIDPLMTIMVGQNRQLAKLAAQASLIFTYRQIGPYISKIISDDTLAVDVKLSAIYALKIRPDKEAISALIRLRDSEDENIATAAAEALQEWFPVTDKTTWPKILKDLKQKSPSEILKDRFMAQDAKINELQGQIDQWQKLYIGAQNNVYENTADDSARAAILIEKLASEHSSLRLWAIKKIETWRKSGKALPLQTLAQPLTKLISDTNAEVRLSTAELVGFLTQVNTTNELLMQLKVETDPPIQAKLLASLGQVCNYALSPGATISIGSEVHREALDFSADYLQKDDPSSAALGAKVMRQLLVQNSLETEIGQKYFLLLKNRYGRETNSANLRSRLLNEMGVICGRNSHRNDEAAKLFGPLFEEALDSNNVEITEAAVAGLVRVDKSRTFKLIKEKNLFAHQSPVIRNETLALAAELGNEDDLQWLSYQLANLKGQEQNKAAFAAMLSIFNRAKASVALDWIAALDQKNGDMEIEPKQMSSILDIAEEKAVAEGDDELVRKIRARQGPLYMQHGQYAQAAERFGFLQNYSSDPNEKILLTADLLEAQLHAGQIDSAVQLLTNHLLAKDLVSDAPVTAKLNDVFITLSDKAAAKAILNAFAKIENPQPRPHWQFHLDKWQNLIDPPDPNKIDPNAPAAEPNSTSAEPN